MTRRPRFLRAARAARAAAVGGCLSLGLLAIQPMQGGCGGPTSAPVGAGAACSLASDCQAGLVCVPQDKGPSTCSNDLSNVEGKPPPEAGTPDAGSDGEAGAVDEGGTPDTDGSTPVKDSGSGTPDTGAPKDAAPE